MMSLFLVDKYDIKIVTHIRIDRKGLSLVLALKQFLNLHIGKWMSHVPLFLFLFVSFLAKSFKS